MCAVPLISGVAFLLVPGAKLWSTATKSLPDIVIEGLKHFVSRHWLIWPGEGRTIALVPIELVRADACPVRVCKLSNHDESHPNPHPVDLLKFFVTHLAPLPHPEEDLHEGLVLYSLG